MGYEGIELRLLGGNVIDPVADRAALRLAVEECRERTIEVCAFDTSCCLNRDVPERRRQVDVLCRWIDRASELDVLIVRVFGGDDPSGACEAVSRVADALDRVAPVAEQAGIRVCLETHDAFSSAREVAQVLQRVPSPAVAALWDSHHPYRMGETADEVASCLNGRIAHVHVKDARHTGDDAWELTLLGHGEVPVKDQLRVLERLGYIGYVSVEWEKKWNPRLAEPEDALPQHIAQLGHWMDDLSKS